MRNITSTSLIQATLLLALMGLCFMPDVAFAQGAGGEAEFGGIYNTVKGWITGTLGKLIALTCFLVGMAMGVVRQSLMAAVIGIAMAIALYYGPVVIDNIFAGPVASVTSVTSVGSIA